MTQRNVVITQYKRTPIGNFGGSLAKMSPVNIGTHCLSNLVSEHPFLKDQTDLVIIGNVLSAGHGQNIARQTSIFSGINESTPAFTLNHVCGSGMQAIITASHYIQTGNADIVIAGGTESMSQSAFCMPSHRWGNKMGHDQLVDTMIKDGLWDAFDNTHMGITAENVAKKYNISREEQDEYAFNSHQKAIFAQEKGFFENEICPVKIKNKKKESVFSKDEFIRHDICKDKLASLRPVFDTNGSVTAGNSSGLNDGAAFVVLMSERKAKELNMPTNFSLKNSTTVGYSPSLMGVAPIKAINKLLKNVNKNVSDIDVFEINEAFASQSIAIKKELDLPSNKLNINGGAIALGHPIGASGTRITVSLLNKMFQTNANVGIAALCIGGGQSTSLLIENNN